MAYTEDELELLSNLPQLIGLAISSASKSGLIGTGKELITSTKSVLAGSKANPESSLIRELLPDPHAGSKGAMEWAKRSSQWLKTRLGDSPTASMLRGIALEDSQKAASILAVNASPSDAERYKSWALSVAEDVAKASAEGGFLGFGGERVTAAERDLIDHVRAALEGTLSASHISMGSRTAAPQEASKEAMVKTLSSRSLMGRKVVITAGSSHEPIGSAHYLAKYSDGKLGYALAGAVVELGAETILISSPLNLPLPPGAQVLTASTAEEMLAQCESELPCDIAILAADTAKWRLEGTFDEKQVSDQLGDRRTLVLVPTIDAAQKLVAQANKRPKLVVEFLFGSQDDIARGKERLDANVCDLAVVVDSRNSDVLSSDSHSASLMGKDKSESWSRLKARDLACQLIEILSAKLSKS